MEHTNIEIHSGIFYICNAILDYFKPCIKFKKVRQMECYVDNAHGEGV